MKKHIKLPEIIEIEYFESLPTTPETDKSFSDYFQKEKKKKNMLKRAKGVSDKKASLSKG
jgi:hypothetical protein